MLAATMAYGSCVRTWSMWSVAEAMEEIMVVSEMGEQWSPNTPPPKTAAIIRPGWRPMMRIMGTAMGIMMAKVPQEVPVEKAIKQEMRNTTAGMMPGLSEDLAA